MSPDWVLAKLLCDVLPGEVSGLGSASDWGVFVGHHPANPTNLIAVRLVDGRLQGKDHRTRETTEFPGFNVLVRSKDHATGYAKIRAIRTAFDSVLRKDVSNTEGTIVTVQGVTFTSTIRNLGQDPDSRHYHFNFEGVLSFV